MALMTYERPTLLTIILDGENCWEYYPNGGVDFLRGLYRPEELAIEIHRFVERVTPKQQSARRRMSALLRRWPEAVGALAAAAFLWLLVVPGSGAIRTESSWARVETMLLLPLLG